MRPDSLIKLLQSVKKQTIYPNEILIIDGSTNLQTEDILKKNSFENLQYFKVNQENRGLTKQRNFGINEVNSHSEIICFLDDDIVLTEDYFEKLLSTYDRFPDSLGVGGYIINESVWKFVGNNYQPTINDFYFDKWLIKEGNRHVARKYLGLDSPNPPGFSSNFSHGRTIGFLPPSDKTYQVEQLMGGVSSFRKNVFDTTKFSTYFEGYGLYEDSDFSIRLAKTGKLYCNTAAKLYHYHDQAGRPNKYNYGKMVVRNGWYIWRVKNPNPEFIHKFKWHSITILLTIIRFINTFTTNKKQEAFTEAIGRTAGWWSLLFKKPIIEK